MSIAELPDCHDDCDVQVRFLDEAGREFFVPLQEAADVLFEAVAPIRSFPSYRGQRNFPGLWWWSKLDRHIGYESWLERDWLMLLDFDPEVVAVASQPFFLRWSTSDGPRSHAPDYFARTTAGTGVVIDCRPRERIRERDAAAFEMTARACKSVGWQFQLLDTPERIHVANIHWLAGYRHPRHYDSPIAHALIERFAHPDEIVAGAHDVGDPIATLPVLYHLLWRRILCIDLTVPFRERSLVAVAE